MSESRRSRIATASVVLALAAALALPAGAGAHAVLKGTTPPAGEVVKKQPKQLVFNYSEPVEGAFGAIRVYDRKGKEVQKGEAFHPNGESKDLAIRLQNGLAKGTYTATYRIISADGHPVSGGLVFSVGKASAVGASVSELLAQRPKTGAATQVGFGIARGLQYAAIALAIGGLVFLLAVWLPGLAAVAGGEPSWAAASEAFAARLRKVLLVAAAVGAVSGALGLVFQGATATGDSFWKALDPNVIRDVLDTRFGTVWGIRVLVWIALAGALAVALAGERRPVLRSASVGATGLALRRGWAGGRGALALLVLPLAFLLISPAASGHASLIEPTEVNVPANVLHVLAVSTWAAGLVMLVAAVTAATRRLEAADRTRLLASVLSRFSPLAFASVMVILATGIVQSLSEVEVFNDPGNLLDTAFGRSVLIKAAILLGPLMALGAYNQRRMIPTLKRIAAGGEPPGPAGLALRRSLRTEVTFIAVVLGVTAALVSYAPAVGVEETGPASVTERLGPADAQLTVDPARVGPNEMHVYLTDARTGAPYDRTKEFTVRLTLPDKHLGPIRQTARKAGPGHYVMDGAVFGVPGDWKVQLTSRTTDFHEDTVTMEVTIR